MIKSVCILDTTWDPSDIEQRQQRFPFLRIIQSKREILGKIRGLAERNDAALDGFYFVHHSDVLEVGKLLEDLVQIKDIVLFTGGSNGADERVYPRSRLKRNLNDFLEYWKKGDYQSARNLLSQKKPAREIDRIRTWIDRAQHDYINILAPLDLLAITYVGGEIDEQTYEKTRDQLIERLRKKSAEFLTEQGSRLRGLYKVFEEAATLFEDPLKTKRPIPLQTGARLYNTLDAQILHVDDEIDNGWDLVMPLLFGDRYHGEFGPENVMERIASLQGQGNPFIVLLDLGLKSGDSLVSKAWRGIDLLLSIRKEFPAVPVHVLSARNDIATYRRASEARANGFIQKPCQALSSDDEATYYRNFRNHLVAARYDIFRYFLYRAFDAIYQGLKSKTIKIPYKDYGDPEWRKRRQNLCFFLEELVNVDLARTMRDREYSAVAIRNLILSLYRPFERKYDEKPPGYLKINLLKSYRNECAHAGGEHSRNGQLHTFDLRDLMLSALLVSDPETFDMDLPDQTRLMVNQAYRTLYREPENSQLNEWHREVKYEHRRDRPFNQRLSNLLPLSLTDTNDPSSRRIYWLITDKILRPKSEKQQVGLPIAPLVEPSSEMRPLRDEDATPRSEKSHAPRPTYNAKPLKDMAYFFKGSDNNRCINFGARYKGVKVDGNDCGQRDFFAWYFDKHIKNSLDMFSSTVIEFLELTYGIGLQGGIQDDTKRPPLSESRSNSTNDPMPASSETGFGLSLFAINASHGKKSLEDALESIADVIDCAEVDNDRRGVVYLDEHSYRDGTATHRYGVRLRFRRTFDGCTQYLQFNPTTKSADDCSDSRFFLDYDQAQRTIQQAADALPWIESQSAISTDFELQGQYLESDSGDLQHANAQRLREVLKGLPLAVIAGLPDVENAVNAWEKTLSKSGAVRIVPAHSAKALVVIVPRNCTEAVIEDVRKRYEGNGLPWKIVNPESGYKDWNVLTGIASRVGASHEPISSVAAADPETLFIGVDLGHRKGEGSTIAATLVDHKGRLLAWTKGPNRGTQRYANSERISEDSMRRLLQALLHRKSDSAALASRRLVIHRDGRTLEDVDLMREIIATEVGIRNVDWLDVDKQGAPIFLLRPDSATGQFVVFENENGRKEMWLRTAPGRARKYSRPLCIVPRESGTDIMSLGREIYLLSNAPTQDYEMKGKLPITTYFADGFSSTGEKRVRFWGYERLWRPWP